MRITQSPNSTSSKSVSAVHAIERVEAPSKTNRRLKNGVVFFVLLFSCVISVGLLLNPHPAHADITTGLVGWWKLDDGSGTTAIDSSGNGYSGTLIGNTLLPVWTTGQIGGALRFGDTAMTGVTLGTQVNSYLSDSNTFTISAWFNTSSTTNQVIIGSDTGGPDRTYITVANGNINLGTYNGGFVCKSAAFTAVNSWHHVVMINSSSVVSGYLDGVAMTGSACPSTDSVHLTTIGGSYHIPYTNLPFYGSIDDVRVYSRALTSQDVSELYAYPAPSLSTEAADTITATGAAAHGTIVGAVPIAAGPLFARLREKFGRDQNG